MKKSLSITLYLTVTGQHAATSQMASASTSCCGKLRFRTTVRKNWKSLKRDGEFTWNLAKIDVTSYK